MRSGQPRIQEKESFEEMKKDNEHATRNQADRESR